MELLDEGSPMTPQDSMTTIGEILSRHGGSILTGPFGTALKASEYSATGVPVISVSEVGFGRIQIEDRTPRVSEETTSRLTKYVLREGDIVFARKGAGTAVERSALVTAKETGWFLGSDGIRLRLPSCCEPKYVSYWFRSHRHRQWMVSNCVGTTMPALNQGIIERIPIALPHLTVQSKLAQILGTLDDKIDLNQRMNETLEAMACTMFRSWFVDFDPVRAKVDGRKPDGLDTATAKLFPDKFEDSPLGQVPKRWRVMPLPEAIEVNPRRSLSKGVLAPYLDMGNMPTRSARATTWEMREGGSGARFVNGDVLLARITPCLENGKTAFVDFLSDGEAGWGSTEYIVLRSKQPLPEEYAYFLARSPELRMFAIQNMTGTSGRQRVPAECFSNFCIVVPPDGLAKRFGDFVKVAMSQMKARDEESATLAAIRDVLLPKLLSGEVSVQ